MRLEGKLLPRKLERQANTVITIYWSRHSQAETTAGMSASVETWIWSIVGGSKWTSRRIKNSKGGWVQWLMPVISALWEAGVSGSPEVKSSRQLDQHGETPSLLKKIQKISWVQWRVPVIPATQEAEAGELPEPRRRRLRWAKIAPLHSSLGNKTKTP